MQRPITRGASAGAGLIFHVFAQDSASTTGAGKASIAFGSWSCRYIRNGEAISGAITPEDITTIGTYAAPTANTNIRIKAVDNTNMIGVYEIHAHADWVNATNSCQSLTIYLTATGVAVLPIQIPLTGYNPQDAVRLGLTALPNAAADAAGGLPISDAGGLDLDAQRSDVAAILVDTNEIGAAGAGLTNINLPNQTMDITGNITGNLSGSVGSVSGAVGSVTGAVGSVTGNVGGNVVGSVASVTAGVTLAVSAVQSIWDALTSALTTVGSVGKLIVDRLDAAITSRASQTTADADHDLTQANIAALNNLSAAQVATELATYDAPTKAELDAAVAPLALETTAQSILADTGTDGVVVAGASKTGYALTSAYDPAKTAAQAGDAMALTAGERNSAADALLARTLGAESYAADGAVPTVAQMLFMLWSGLVEFSITGTTLTCKKLDGSTTAMTFTLDDASAPTSRTRAT